MINLKTEVIFLTIFNSVACVDMRVLTYNDIRLYLDRSICANCGKTRSFYFRTWRCSPEELDYKSEMLTSVILAITKSWIRCLTIRSLIHQSNVIHRISPLSYLDCLDQTKKFTAIKSATNSFLGSLLSQLILSISTR